MDIINWPVRSPSSRRGNGVKVVGGVIVILLFSNLFIKSTSFNCIMCPCWFLVHTLRSGAKSATKPKVKFTYLNMLDFGTTFLTK